MSAYAIEFTLENCSELNPPCTRPSNTISAIELAAVKQHQHQQQIRNAADDNRINPREFAQKTIFRGRHQRTDQADQRRNKQRK